MAFYTIKICDIFLRIPPFIHFFFFRMDQIVQDLMGINNVQFSYNGFLSLTEYIHDLTRYYKVPFSADHTDLHKPTATYTCTFGGYLYLVYS